MNFINAVKELNQGKVFQREPWKENWFRVGYFVKDEYGILKLFKRGRLENYEVTDEDVCADDWMEVQKEQYKLTRMHEEEGVQYFTIKENDSYSNEIVLNYFEFKQLLNYLDIHYDDIFKDMMKKIKNPSIQPFDYNFRKCPLCENEIEFDDVNYGKCSRGCVSYDVDPQGEDVLVYLFNNKYKEDHYLINLYHDCWESNNRERIVNLRKFQENVLYWKENERYKERLKQMKKSN